MSELDDRIAAEMRAIKGPSEMVRLVPEGRADRQVAAVRDAITYLDRHGHLDAHSLASLRNALETE